MEKEKMVVVGLLSVFLAPKNPFSYFPIEQENSRGDIYWTSEANS